MSIYGALLTRVINGGKLFQVKYIGGKPKSSIPNITNYGFFSRPPENSKIIIVEDGFGSFYAIGWQDSNENPLIEALKPGEAIGGNFVKGSIIKFDEDGNIDITCNGNKTITVTGNCTINVTGDASVTAENITATATTKATVTAPTTEIVATTAVDIISPLTTITGGLTVTGTTTIETKPFLTHVHPAGTPPGNTGVVV